MCEREGVGEVTDITQQPGVSTEIPDPGPSSDLNEPH